MTTLLKLHRIAVLLLFVGVLTLSGRFASSSPKGGAKCAFHHKTGTNKNSPQNAFTTLWGEFEA